LDKIVILTDSTSDLPLEFTIREDVQIIPLFIRFEDAVYKDGVDISTKDLIQKMKESNEIARSMGLRAGDFHIAYNKYIRRGYDVLYIGIGSNLSSSIQSALIAKQELGKTNVHIVDSKTTSAGLGLLVKKAVELRKEGLSAYEIKNRLDAMVPKIKTFYMISDLELLYQGLRLKKFQYKLGKLLRMKPLVTLVNDQVTMISRPLGKLDHTIHTMFKHVKRELKHESVGDLVITHSVDETCLGKLEKEMSHLKPSSMMISMIGCVLGCQVGEGAVGIAFMDMHHESK
jgi:DegV family protein with EDD domain